jgi:4'-phosphopantetheinyl transferase
MDELVTAAPGRIPATSFFNVHLWWAPLDLPASSSMRLARHLSPEERLRAATFRHTRDRNRFVAARGWLRQLLGEQLDCSPGLVPITVGATGKPAVRDSDLQFSVATSGEMALYATSRGTEVGVDVEAIKPTTNVDDLARRFFSEAEQRTLRRMSPAKRLPAAVQAWTCKEAYVKATGAGLDDDVILVDSWNASGEPAIVDGWSVRQVEVAPGYAAAVAVNAIHASVSLVSQVQGGSVR